MWQGVCDTCGCQQKYQGFLLTTFEHIDTGYVIATNPVGQKGCFPSSRSVSCSIRKQYCIISIISFTSFIWIRAKSEARGRMEDTKGWTDRLGCYCKAVLIPPFPVSQGKSIQMGAIVCFTLPMLQGSCVQTAVQKPHNCISTGCACKGDMHSSPGLC